MRICRHTFASPTTAWSFPSRSNRTSNMEIFRSLDQIPSDFGPTVTSIGNFDGVHRGHQWLLSEIQKSAKELGAKSVAVTFDPHPSRLLRPENALKLITPMPQRLELLGASGIDAVLVLP